MAQPLSPVEALVPPAVETLTLGTPFCAAFIPTCRRLERSTRVVQPDVDALDQEAADPHVVVLEDEHAATELLVSADRWKISWMTRCPGRSAGCALPAKMTCTGRCFVPTACGPVDRCR
jgi:hypothetical protein